MTERRTVQVFCCIPNGIELQLMRQGFDDGTGMRPQRRHGAPVRVGGPSGRMQGVGALSRSPEASQAAVTDVDAEFWAEWLEQNGRNPVVEQGWIGEVRPTSDP